MRVNQGDERPSDRKRALFAPGGELFPYHRQIIAFFDRYFLCNKDELSARKFFVARISEIHFADTHASATGIGEFFEVSLSAGESASDFVVSTYNETGLVYVEIPLTHPDIVVTGPDGYGETIYTIYGADFGFLLTNPTGGNANNEAVALTDVSGASNVVIDFYDIGGGGSVTATNGAASGVTSTNLSATYTTSIQFNQPNPGTPVLGTTNPGIACFAEGTKILTDAGEVNIEDLVKGDMVQTLDHGLQEIKWIGSQDVDGRGALAPYKITAGSFGNTADVYVSPAHRVLIEGWRAELFFGSDSVLVSANMLKGHDGIARAPKRRVRYFHVMFDQHQIIFSSGMASESYYPGAVAIDALEDETRQELYDIFPDLNAGLQTYSDAARPVLRGYEGDLLCANLCG